MKAADPPAPPVPAHPVEGAQVVDEPNDLPHPLRAQDVTALVRKIVD